MGTAAGSAACYDDAAMTTRVDDLQLWSWIDREAPELDEYLERCPGERGRVERIRATIRGVVRETTLPAPPLPERIGPYRVEGVLGEGGMGVVYRAEQENPRRPVAVKVIRSELAGRAEQVSRFQREALVLARLNHPGIARIHEAGQTEDGRHYLVMELVEGRPLGEYVRERSVPRAERLRLFVEIASAVHSAHESGVIHRDLKPANVLVDAEGRPRVLDFGLARIARSDLALSMSTQPATGGIAGTPQFMSPEQISGTHEELDRRTDVYALGVILFQLLTDELPYDLAGKSLPEMARTVCEKPPRRPEGIDPSLRGDLSTIVLKALEKEPGRRYASARAMADDVQRFLEDRPIRARPPTAVYRARKLVARHKAISVLVLAVLVLLAALLTPGSPIRIDAGNALVGGRGPTERSPFTRVRWAGATPHVEIEGRWYEPLEIDGLRVPLLVEFCRQTAEPEHWWRKRFAEDLVQVFDRLGRRLRAPVTVEARDLATGEHVTLERVAATARNRHAVWEDRGRLPFTDLRWSADTPEIEVRGRWYELIAVEGIAARALLEVAERDQPSLGRAELGIAFGDLLTEALGESPPPRMTLELRDLATGESLSLDRVESTSANGQTFIENRRRRDLSTVGESPP